MKSRNTYSRYSKSLLDRIDSMTSDKDYDPYQPEKRHTVTDDSLFNNRDYLSEDELEALDKESENSSNSSDNIEGEYNDYINSFDDELSDEESKGSSSTVLIVVGIIAVLILCVGAFFVLKH